MADNVAITAGSGTTIAADELTDGTLGSVKVQFVKLMDGTLDGTSKALVDADGLSVKAVGLTASGSSLTAKPVTTGGLAKTALPTAVSDGQVVNALLDKFGRQVVLSQAPRDLVGTQTTTISASTAETNIGTAGAAGVFNDISEIIISNTSAATDTRVDIRDATAGSVIASIMSIGGAPSWGMKFDPPIPQTSAANNWTAQCAVSTTDVRVFVKFVKNK